MLTTGIDNIPRSRTSWKNLSVSTEGDEETKPEGVGSKVELRIFYKNVQYKIEIENSTGAHGGDSRITTFKLNSTHNRFISLYADMIINKHIYWNMTEVIGLLKLGDA